jgi:GMP reductase
MMNTELNYGDVYLVPRKTIVDSRKECDTRFNSGHAALTCRSTLQHEIGGR